MTAWLPAAFGINFYPPGPNPQWVYVTNTSTLVRYAYKNGDLKATGEPEKLITDIPAGGGHSTRDIVFSKDGKSLFLAVGSASNNNDNDAEFHRANILEYTPEGKIAILKKLIEAEGFERFLHKRFPGTKRFGLDGAESAVPVAQQFFVSLMWIYVAYSGWNAATYVAEELRNPARTLPIALAIGTGLVTVLYLGLNLIFIYAAPLQDLKGKLAVGAFAASRLFGPEVASLFSALMALSLMATVNAMVTIGPRVYFAMAKNGAFLKAAAEVHPKWHTPVAAIVAQGVCSMLLSMTPFPQLVIYIGFMLNFFAVLSVGSLFLLRSRPGWRKLRVLPIRAR